MPGAPGPTPPGMFPPPGMMPPPGMFPPPGMMPPVVVQQSGGRSFANAILLTLATTIFGASLLLNFWLLATVAAQNAATSSGAAATRQVVIKGSDAKNKIAVVKLDGVIAGESRDKFMGLLEAVRKDNTVRALVLEIDSPGGGVTASDEIYDAIVDLKKEKNIKVYASMNSLAASGGYYIACAADEIYAQRTTLTGSIGVLFSRMDLSAMGEKYGIRDGSIVSDGATYKDAGSMFKELTPDQTVYFKSILNDAFDTFKNVIKEGRGDRLKGDINEIANGKIYSARQAKELGLVDGDTQYLNDVIDIAVQSLKLVDPTIIRIERTPTFFEQLAGGQAKAGAGVNVNLNLNLDQKMVRDLFQPQVMYLWTGH
jgi:protease IV